MRPINFLHLNVNSLTLEASNELDSLLNAKNIDVAAIQETFIEELPVLPGYSNNHQRRNGKGGGTVFIYKTSSVKLPLYKRLCIQSQGRGHLELLTCSFGDGWHLANLYIPPQEYTDDKLFLK